MVTLDLLEATMPNVPRRQKQVGILVAQGFTNEEIAEKLGISRGTVETHRSDLFVRVGVHSAVELAHYALARGWIQNLYQQRGRPRKDLDEE